MAAAAQDQAAAARAVRADDLEAGAAPGAEPEPEPELATDDDPAAAALLEAALARLALFHANADEQTLMFPPDALSPEQRNFVRMKGVALGYKGKSKGGGQARHLVINKSSAPKEPELTWQQRRARRNGVPDGQPGPEPELDTTPSLVHGDNEDPSSAIVFLRKIPRSVGRLEIMAVGESKPPTQT